MNIHKNARLTLVRRIEMVRDIVEARLTPAEAAHVLDQHRLAEMRAHALGEEAPENIRLAGSLCYRACRRILSS